MRAFRHLSAALLLLLALGAVDMSASAPADEPKTDTVSATDLRAAFHANVIAAEKKYVTNKAIRVTGAAYGLRKDVKGGYLFFVGDITCHLSKDGEKAAADLQQGSKVVVTGTLAVTPGPATVALELKGCTLEILPEEKKEEVKKDPKAPEPLEEPYTEYVTIQGYHAMIVPEGGGEPEPGFFKPRGNVHAYRVPGKDGATRFVVKGPGKSGAFDTGVKSELTDKEGVVWIVTKATKRSDRLHVDVERKP